jgi:metallo-beta-lactamase family protein
MKHARPKKPIPPTNVPSWQREGSSAHREFLPRRQRRLATMIACWMALTFCLRVPLSLNAAGPTKLAATSFGAAGEVSGSLHVLDTGNGRWMIDCGAMAEKSPAGQPSAGATADEPQGPILAQSLPSGVEAVSAVFLTHAHADHLGRLPLLVDRGFAGPIYMTEATAALAVPMLRVLLRCDQGTVRHWTWPKQSREQAARDRKAVYVHWRNCRRRQEIAPEAAEQATCSMQELGGRFGAPAARWKIALCSECLDEQIAAALRNVRPVKYAVATDAAPGVRVTFLDAGHIPGSASILFEVALGAKKRRVLFSGDLGNHLSPLRPAPRPAPEADAVFVEATYGPISRKAAVREQPAAFRHAVAESVARGGVAWIPCFALERTQRILYELHLAQREKLLPDRLPIYCPSPTAREVTDIYNVLRPRGWFSPAITADADAFAPQEMRFRTPPGKRLPRPSIIIHTGDPLVAPWMRRLLSTLLPEPSTSIVLVGYQTAGSAGELLLHGATKLDIDGQAIPVRAKVHCFSCFSGHADATEIDAWLSGVSKQATLVLVHGDREQILARAAQLRGQDRPQVMIAQPGETIGLE